MTECSHRLPWFQNDYQILLERLSKGYFPRSLLLTGESNIGKSVFAHDLAKSILCLKPLNNSACGTCQSCLWIASVTHPDLLVVKKEEKSQFIRVEQIRQLIHNVQLTSETGRKVIIIEDADKMNLNAANALLKTLEEPPEDCFFILISSFPKKLPITISSRCQKYNLSLQGSQAAVEKWLSNKFKNHSASTIQQALFFSYHRPLLAERFLSCNYIEIVQELEGLFSHYLEQRNNLTELSAYIVKNKHITLHVILYWLQNHLNDKNSHSVVSHFLSQQKNTKTIVLYENFIILMKNFNQSFREDWLINEWLLSL